ncbi:MAG: hypothetical protein ACREM3_19070 [Candidatus Rokuibacteriota bacterium]
MRITRAHTAGARRAEVAVVALLTVGLLGYAVFALAGAGWWLSGLVAPLVALLLAVRHARARFSAYVFLTVVALRSAATGQWAALVFASVAIAALQTPAALRVWPRLRAAARMARP